MSTFEQAKQEFKDRNIHTLKKILGLHDVKYNDEDINIIIINNDNNTITIAKNIVNNFINNILNDELRYNYIIKLVDLFCNCKVGNTVLRASNNTVYADIKIGITDITTPMNYRTKIDPDEINTVQDYIDKICIIIPHSFENNHNGIKYQVNSYYIYGGTVNITIDHIAKIYDVCKNFTREDIKNVLAAKYNVKFIDPPEFVNHPNTQFYTSYRKINVTHPCIDALKSKITGITDVQELLKIKKGVNVELDAKIEENILKSRVCKLTPEVNTLKVDTFTITHILNLELETIDTIDKLSSLKKSTAEQIDEKIQQISQAMHKEKYNSIIGNMDKHLQDFNNKHDKNKNKKVELEQKGDKPQITDEIVQNTCIKYKRVLQVGMIMCQEDFNKMFLTDFGITSPDDVRHRDLIILNHILYVLDQDVRDILLLTL